MKKFLEDAGMFFLIALMGTIGLVAWLRWPIAVVLVAWLIAKAIGG